MGDKGKEGGWTPQKPTVITGRGGDERCARGVLAARMQRKGKKFLAGGMEGEDDRGRRRAGVSWLLLAVNQTTHTCPHRGILFACIFT